jgi:hypothetical protein
VPCRFSVVDEELECQASSRMSFEDDCHADKQHYGGEDSIGLRLRMSSTEVLTVLGTPVLGSEY